MDVWREAEACGGLGTTGLQSASDSAGGEPIDAGVEAARWKFFYRDPGCVLPYALPHSTAARPCSIFSLCVLRIGLLPW